VASMICFGPSHTEARPQVLRSIFLSLVALSIILAGAVFPRSVMANSTASSDAAPAEALPAITLIDQNGKPLSLASLRGRPVLLGFVHTSCKGPCELMTAKMKQVEQKLGSHEDSKIAMVTVTTDPDHDGPAEMLKYAKAQGADQPGWFFLSGRPADVRRFLAVYNVAHEETEEDEMTHVLDLYLIAPDGTRARHYQGTTTSPNEIASDIRKTLAAR
jgi:protein SCO1